MAYFTTVTLPDLATLRGNATTLNGPTTIVFPSGGGSYWFKVNAPIAGNVIAALPDVSIINGGPLQILQDTVVWGSETIYQVSSSGQLVTNSVSNGIADQVLQAQFPNATYNDLWQQLVIAPGKSNGYLNEFYLEIKAQPESDFGAFQQFGVSIPNEGRVLITDGQVTGARNAAWGNWLDTITLGGGPGTPGGDPGNPQQPDQPDEYDLLASSAGTSTWSGSQMVGSLPDISADPTTGQIYRRVGSFAPTPIPELNADVQQYVAQGFSLTDAVKKVYDKLASAEVGLFGGGYATYVQGSGELAPGVPASPTTVAWAGAVNQGLTSIGVFHSFRNLHADLMGLLNDEISAVTHGGPAPDIEQRVNQAFGTFFANAGASLAGATGSALQLIYNGFSWITSKVGFVMENSAPTFQTFIKNADDTSMTVLPPGHSDRYYGTDYADRVTVNANSAAYGAGGNDVLVGNVAGGDVLSGGLGNDTLQVGGGSNILDGGHGFDTAVLPYRQAQVSLVRNGDGTYTATTPSGVDRLTHVDQVRFMDGTVELSVSQPAPSDFTGTGTSGVLLQNGGSVVDWILKNGQYQSGNVLTAGATGWQVVGAGDFTGTGTSGVLLQNGGSVVDWILKNGQYQSGNVLTTGAAGWQVVGTGDFNDNGTSDVLLQNGGTVVDWVMQYGQYQSGNVLTTGAAGWQVVGTGDFNGNGTSDVVLQNGGTVVDWLIENGQYQSGNVLTTGAAGWQVVGTGDFDGNGTSDVLLQNGGTVVEWIMNNGQYQSGNVLTTGATGWQVVGTGDYNGDGTSDVLLQNGGTAVDWIMQNGKYSSGNVLTTGAAGWTVAHT